MGSITTPGLASLLLRNGDTQLDIYLNTQIRLGFGNTDKYQHYITTRHNSASIVNNAIDFYTSDSTENGVYPTNAIHGMSINGGKVGIGVKSPTSPLTISGSLEDSTGGMRLIGKTTPTDISYWTENALCMQYSGVFTNVLYSKGDNYLCNRADLKLGIGTNAPTSKLHIVESVVDTWTTQIINTAATAGKSYGLFVKGGTSTADMSLLVRSKADDEYFKIRGDGNVAIGTDTPDTKLTVKGVIRSIRSIDTSYAQFSAEAGAATFEASNGYFYFLKTVGDWANPTMMMVPNGNIGVGNVAPVSTLDVSGVITASGGNSTSWNLAYGYGDWHTPLANASGLFLKKDGSTPLTADWNAGSNKITCSGIVNTSRGTFLPTSGIIYFGPVTNEGSWRITIEAGNMVFQKYESSNWVTKVTMAA